MSRTSPKSKRHEIISHESRTICSCCCPCIIRNTRLHQHLPALSSLCLPSIRPTHSGPCNHNRQAHQHTHTLRYSCRLHSAASHLSGTLSKNVYCHTTPTCWHTYCRLEIHTNVLYICEHMHIVWPIPFGFFQVEVTSL